MLLLSIRRREGNNFVFYRNPGADMTLSPKEIDKSDIAKSKLFHFGSITITAEPWRSAALEAVSYAKEHNVLVSFDPNFRSRLWRSLNEARDTILKIIPTVDLLKMNEEECNFITGTKDLAEGTRWLLQRGPKIVVIIRGEEGSFFCSMRGSFSFLSYEVDVVDTVGCGDAFTAAFIYQVLLLVEQGEDISNLCQKRMRKILRFANAASALTATGKGVISSLPSNKMVEKFLRER